MDADLIFSKQLKQIEKEKKDKEMKLKSQEKKVCTVISSWSALMVGLIILYRSQVDYFERAKRLVEVSLLQRQYEDQRKTDREFHTELENQKVAITLRIPLLCVM